LNLFLIFTILIYSYEFTSSCSNLNLHVDFLNINLVVVEARVKREIEAMMGSQADSQSMIISLQST